MNLATTHTTVQTCHTNWQKPGLSAGLTAIFYEHIQTNVFALSAWEFKKFHAQQLTSANALRNSPPGAIPNCLVRCADILNRRMYIRPWKSPFCLMVDCTLSVYKSSGIIYTAFPSMLVTKNGKAVPYFWPVGLQRTNFVAQPHFKVCSTLISVSGCKQTELRYQVYHTNCYLTWWLDWLQHGVSKGKTHAEICGHAVTTTDNFIITKCHCRLAYNYIHIYFLNH